MHRIAVFGLLLLAGCGTAETLGSLVTSLDSARETCRAYGLTDEYIESAVRAIEIVREDGATASDALESFIFGCGNEPVCFDCGSALIDAVYDLR